MRSLVGVLKEGKKEANGKVDSHEKNIKDHIGKIKVR